MNRARQYILSLLALCLAVPVFAGDKDQIRCGVNQDRVWVYDTLTSFDVGAHLKCGEIIEVVSRVKGYVKVRSATGAEGYVPDSALPDLPPLPDPDNKVGAANPGGPPFAGSAASLGAAAKAARGTAKPLSIASATPATPYAASSAANASVPVAPAPQVVANNQPLAATPPPASAPVPAPAPASPSPVAANPLPAAAPVSVPAPVIAVVNPSPPPAPAVNAKPATAPAMPPSNATPQQVAVSTQPPVALSVAPPVPVVTVATSPLAATPVSVASPTPIALVTNSSATPAPAATSAPAKPAKHSKPVPERTMAPSVASSPVPAKNPTVPAREAKLDAPARTYPIRDVVSSPRTTGANAAIEVPIGSEYPDTQPENESTDPACHTFFSAYGLSPSQFKWLAANRRKLYPSICPAPDLASVDFVILFTHDSDTYNAAMPTPVRTDRAGFSDFNPLTTIDTALLSGSDADHARREYVWVFRTRRGGFDPVKFSPRRRPQFSTTESKGAARAIEDAFNYLQEQGTRLEAAQ